jgi:hypothetical protein
MVISLFLSPLLAGRFPSIRLGKISRGLYPRKTPSRL